jgi:uncharacterized protein (TIGR00730 family)
MSSPLTKLDRPAHIAPMPKPPKIRSVCVYCGSGEGSDPSFAIAARAFGRLLAEANVRLVYGGGGLGLMGALANSVTAHGGHVTGIIPSFLKDRERPPASNEETLVVTDMHERKRMMFERADAFVALPGGIGTLEELVEQLTWAQLGRHKKPILLLNQNGFWNPLLNLIAHMRLYAFIRPDIEVRYMVAERIEDVLPMLQAAVERAGKASPQAQEVVGERF